MWKEKIHLAILSIKKIRENKLVSYLILFFFREDDNYREFKVILNLKIL
jgi:hypothetical protein